MSYSFRIDAQKALDRAKIELALNDNERVRYAALELRMCVEALLYEKAQAYGDEFPPSKYSTWQPREVLRYLVQFDPMAEKSCSMSIQRESGIEEPPYPKVDLGTQEVFSLKDIKDLYEPLGSYLHYPTLKQTQEGSVSLEKLRTSCVAIAARVEQILNSRIVNSIFSSRITFKCAGCGKQLDKRVPVDGGDGHAVCDKCKAEFLLRHSAETGLYLPVRKTIAASCSASCGHQHFIPIEKLSEGYCWTCPECKAQSEIRYASAAKSP